jgi:hypothetical protein
MALLSTIRDSPQHSGLERLMQKGLSAFHAGLVTLDREDHQGADHQDAGEAQGLDPDMLEPLSLAATWGNGHRWQHRQEGPGAAADCSPPSGAGDDGQARSSGRCVHCWLATFGVLLRIHMFG